MEPKAIYVYVKVSFLLLFIITDLASCSKNNSAVKDAGTDTDIGTDSDTDTGPLLEGTIELTVEEPSGVDRTNAIVRGGIPFPKGVLSTTQNLQLRYDNQEVEASYNELAPWEDDTIRWVLVEFMDDFSSNETKTYELEYGPDVSTAPHTSALTVQASADLIQIDTGLLEAEVDKVSGSLFKKIAYQGEILVDGELEKNTTFADGSGGLQVLDIDTLEVEEQTDTSVTVKLTDHDSSNNFFFDVRLTFFANSSDIQIEQTTTVATLNEDHLAILGEIGINIPLSQNATTYHLGMVGGECNGGAFTGSTKDLSQFASDQYTLEGISHTGSHVGYASLQTNNASITTTVQDWWQTYPKQIILDPSSNEMTIYLWAGEDRTLFEEVEDPPGPEVGEAGDPQGTSKSHRVFLSFSEEEISESSIQNKAKSFNQTLLLQSPIDWNMATKALYFPLFPYQGEDSKIEAAIRTQLQTYGAALSKYGFYGFWDYGDIRSVACSSSCPNCVGDWCVTGRHGWRNGNIDVHQMLLINYFRTGKREWFEQGEAMVRHIRDVDTIHYYPELEKIYGATRRHNREHWGERSTGSKYTNYGGLITYYYLTGDLRTRDVLENEMTDFLLYIANRSYGLASWQMIISKLVELWTVNHSQDLWDKVMEILDGNPDKDWLGIRNMELHQIANVYDTDAYPSSYGSFSGMATRGALGLWHYWMITGDADIPMILKAMHETSLTTEETYDFSYWSKWDTAYLGAIFDSSPSSEYLNLLMYEMIHDVENQVERAISECGTSTISNLNKTLSTWWYSPTDYERNSRAIIYNLGALVHGSVASNETDIYELWEEYNNLLDTQNYALSSCGSVATASSSYPSTSVYPDKSNDGDMTTRWRGENEPSLSNPISLTITFPETKTVGRIRIDNSHTRCHWPLDFEVLCDSTIVESYNDVYDSTIEVILGMAQDCNSISVNATEAMYGKYDGEVAIAINEIQIFGNDFEEPDLLQP